MKPCIIIPVYNHEHAIVQVISRLKGYGIPCLLVNDGSSAACSQVLEDCARQESGWLTLVNRAKNGGKGAAVIDGFNAANSWDTLMRYKSTPMDSIIPMIFRAFLKPAG